MVIVAGRALRSCLAISTMIGSELGLVTVMYSAQKGFTDGFAVFHIGLVAGVITLLVGMTGFIVVPLRRMRVMTIPEFYEKRFGRGVRVLGGMVLALAGILNMGLFLKAGTAFVTGAYNREGSSEKKARINGTIDAAVRKCVAGPGGSGYGESNSSSARIICVTSSLLCLTRRK